MSPVECPHCGLQREPEIPETLGSLPDSWQAKCAACGKAIVYTMLAPPIITEKPEEFVKRKKARR